jgi:hypothetical protein
MYITINCLGHLGGTWGLWWSGALFFGYVYLPMWAHLTVPKTVLKL